MRKFVCEMCEVEGQTHIDWNSRLSLRVSFSSFESSERVVQHGYPVEAMVLGQDFGDEVMLHKR